MDEYNEKKVQKQKYTWDFRLLNEKSNEQWMNITESFLMQGLVVSQRRFSKNWFTNKSTSINKVVVKHDIMIDLRDIFH